MGMVDVIGYNGLKAGFFKAGKAENRSEFIINVPASGNCTNKPNGPGKTMKILLFIIIALLALFAAQFCFAQKGPARTKLTDGPFVFYRGDSLMVRSVVRGKAVSGNFAVSGKEKLRLAVRFEEAPLPGFSVQLKKQLLNEPGIFGPADKMLVISDMEGEFAVMRSLLLDGGVMDRNYNWTFGKGHLVVVGDHFDRGKQVTQGLWLLYRLEALAKAAGGYVHVLLGNHDIMNLSGDLRYLDKKYKNAASALGVDYMKLYGKDTELGRWLRSKNVVEQIGEALFTHGGISPAVNASKLNLQQINTACRPYYDCNKKDIPEAAQLFFGKDGPFWYRGYFYKPKADLATVEQTLSKFEVKKIVVGHSITEGNVGFYYGGKVLGVDVDAHAGDKEAAFYENGYWYKLLNGKLSPILEDSGWLEVKGSNGTVPMVFKDFRLSEGKGLVSAKLSVTALGLYRAQINGKKVGDSYFTPGWTSYLNRLQYQNYGVTGLLSKGTNRLSVLLSGGWYSGAFGPQKKPDSYGSEKALNCKLLLEFSDGTRQELVSGPDWQVRSSFIKRSDFYDGELQDSRIPERVGLREGFILMRMEKTPPAMLVRSLAPPVRKQEVFKVLKSWKSVNGDLMLDFGQNLAGFVRIRLRGNAGDTLRIAHSEMLDQHGGLFTGNLRLAQATDQYVLNGSDQVLEPVFTYHGFRYVRISGHNISALDVKNMEAVALYSDMKPAGTFSCSDPMLNRLQSNILWSMRSNFVDVPTDCPQRSERFGWTGDAQVFVRTAAWNYDVLSFYKKYLLDLAADQGTNGGVPNIVPDFMRPDRQDKAGVAGWGDAAVLIPWRLYQIYGDKNILEEQYESMKAWVDYVRRRTTGGLWKDEGYGDWYAQGDSTSIPFIDQCYYAYSSRLLSKSAELIGLKQDAFDYGKLSEEAIKAFMDSYGQFNTPATSTQTAYLLALAFDLLPESRRQQCADLLAQRIAKDGNKLATGFLGTPFLLPELSRFGYGRLAYQLLFNRQMPSWLYPITKGATTIWEKWDAVRPDGSLQECSFNHFAYGAVGEWFYSGILGIQPAEVGFKKFIIKPSIGGGLSWAKGSYLTPSGKIGVSWSCKDEKVMLEVEIPKGITAEVHVPGESIARKVGSGRFNFKGRFGP
ncbi:Calcineurin-like phosphoesterase [Mucilaginibacter pineti]|uniref:alpha-L-rhamnosidase n=1 Tax=Mucilaginibacter pineti TaxID=1391627 RepID=A0A1G7II68_9SPHI|nr:family 78 glycoside hydrolase catalytic domain [Mucilaginibacter pineti]SDF12417.1 Calcineurin-like phosphoesterase [Mucilaginibacter pineti]